MNRAFALSAVVVLMAAVLCGCRSGSEETVSTKTTTIPTTEMPNMTEILPDTEDTIGETNGANQHDAAGGNTIDEESGKNETSPEETTQEHPAPRKAPTGRIVPRQ